MQGMKIRIANTCLALSAIADIANMAFLFIHMLIPTAPYSTFEIAISLFLVAAILALVAVVIGSWRMRTYGIILVIVSLAGATVFISVKLSLEARDIEANSNTQISNTNFRARI